MIYTTNGGEYRLDTILIDLNGTLTVHGNLDHRVAEKVKMLKEIGYTLVPLTGDQRNSAENFGFLDIDIVIAKNAAEKKAFALSKNPDTCVAIGNARIDNGMFEVCKLRIATLQGEGIHTGILSQVDILMVSIVDAFDLLIDPNVFVATMKV